MASKGAFDYPGKNANVTWHGNLCIHISECGRAKGDLFVTGRKPWCQPDAVDDDNVREVVLRCPTGALSYEYEDRSNAEVPPDVNTIHVSYNGPLFVSGDFDLDGAPDDVPGLKYHAALCRCGKSANNPSCDNSHEAEKFQDCGAVGDTGPGIEDSAELAKQAGLWRRTRIGELFS
jgi:uncharacterized Fe-S cluster protein YjdI/CDGSH-type Zn-finger protein